MWPVAGVKVGRVDAVERSFVRDVTAESWAPSVTVNGSLLPHRGTYHPAADNVPHRRRHVDVDSIHIVAADWRDLVLHAVSLAPILLPNDPHTTVLDFGPIVRWIMRDHVFNSLHLPQPPLKGLAHLDEMVHARLMEGLYGYDGVVRGLIEEGGSCKVGQYYSKRLEMQFGVNHVLACVGVDATHLLGTEGVVPHDFVQGRCLGVTHVDGNFAAYIDVQTQQVSYDTK